MDYAGDAAAIAAIFPTLAPPAVDPRAVRDGTSTPDSAPGPTPAVFVFLDDSDLAKAGNGTRLGVTRYIARLLIDEAADLAHDNAAVLAWASVLADTLKTHVQLAGRPNVARCVVDGLAGGIVPWAGRSWAGVDVRIRLVTSEPWAAAP
jgi:hypothetical protein